jgi:hypothetical protein
MLHDIGEGLTVLAVQPTNLDRVYAVIAQRNRHSGPNRLGGLWRTNDARAAAPNWQRLAVNIQHDLVDNQGDYDLALAVDPNNPDIVYLGGAVSSNNAIAGLYRRSVDSAGTVHTDLIGNHVHPDIHALAFVPGDSNRLWVGCDGGVYSTANANDRTHPVRFVSRNSGLSTLQVTRIGLHPNHNAVLYIGTQDNGTLRYTGEEVWREIDSGDGGFIFVNQRHPDKVLHGLTFEKVARANDGGQNQASWAEVDLPLPGDELITMSPAAAIVPSPSSDPEANLVAVGAQRVWLSRNFGQSWVALHPPVPPAPPTPAGYTPNAHSLDLSRITALTFESAHRLFVGTRWGHVYRYDHTPPPPASVPTPAAQWAPSTWSVQLIPQGTLPLNPITSIAVDLAVAADLDGRRSSIYVTLGGRLAVSSTVSGTMRVWRFSGGTWSQRSGPMPADTSNLTTAEAHSSLLDAHHAVVLVDPTHTATLYAGADIGVWCSGDSGNNWAPYGAGLPDAAVVDLQLKNSSRTLYAGTHGRGVYTITADPPTPDPINPVNLLIRHTQLDDGQRPFAPGGTDPTRIISGQLQYGMSPDIRVDPPAADGSYRIPETVEIGALPFLRAVPPLRSDGAAVTFRHSSGTAGQVYVQVHNRALRPASHAIQVQVTLLIAPRSQATPPDLPPNYDVQVRSGGYINDNGWSTVDIVTVDDVHALKPGVARFRLNAVNLTGGGNEFWLLALLHSPDSPFPSGIDVVVQNIVRSQKLATYQRLHVNAQPTRQTSHPDATIFTQTIQTIGLGHLVADASSDGLDDTVGTPLTQDQLDA